jgi:putative addiction module component (TIGR02574 family)
MPAMTTAELRSNVLRLPAEDRAAIARDLIASLDAGDADPNAESLWATEIERRARDVADSRVALVDADEVHAEAARRLRTRAGG